MRVWMRSKARVGAYFGRLGPILGPRVTGARTLCCLTVPLSSLALRALHSVPGHPHGALTFATKSSSYGAETKGGRGVNPNF